MNLKNAFYRFIAKFLVAIMLLQGCPLWELSQTCKYEWNPSKLIYLLNQITSLFSTSEVFADESLPDITEPFCLDISARSKSGKVQLTWTHLSDTERYDVYRSAESDPFNFVKIGETTSTYSTYLDSTVVNEITYLYIVGALNQGTWCYSNVTSSHPTFSRTTFNYAPVIYSSSIKDGTVGITYNYDVNATDPNGDDLIYSLIEGPSGMTINSSTGLIQWTPTDGQTGDNNVTVRVQDTGSLFDTQEFTVSVSSSGPTIVTIPGVVGQPQADAEAAIIAAGLVLGAITTANNATVPAGSVISQNPIEGTAVAFGTAVDLVVSLGPVMVSVPGVVGQPQADAEAAITAAGLVVGTVTTANSATVPAGNVISQNPLEGTAVVLGTAVNLFVSLGPVMVSVPGVVGQPQTDAEAAITAAGLIVGTVTTANSATVPAGNVISQNPLEGTAVILGTAVDLVVSLGPVMVAVPGVVGQPQADAEAAITAAGLVLGAITTANSDSIPAGNVISQNPIEGTPVVLGTAVNLVVSLGPVMVSVPGVVGQPQADAEAAITAAGLVLGAITTANSTTVPAGSVISQNPLEGTAVALGTAVNLFVSLGPVMVSVPGVVGQPQADAEAAITAVGLVVGTVTTANSATVPAGNVISQNPLEGTAVILGTAVDLVVSLGPVMVPVPGVVGQPQADAETTITAAGLIVGTVTTANSATVPAGNVISQNPVEGTAVILGTAVDLVVSLGPVVTDDLIPPILTISANPSPVNKGENITITIVAVDNVGVVLLELNVDGIPVPLDANGIGIFSSNTPGSFLATATAQDAAGNSFSDSVEFIVIDPDISSIPTAEITSPEEDSELYETTNVIGTASGSDFMQYTLEYAPHGSNDYIIFAEDTSPITDNVLGVFDPTLLANGLYTIRLTAISIGGQYAVSTKIVQVIGKRKVGLFTLSFKDKVVPIGKFHLEVSRTYDSRDKTKGDFGYGWKLDLNDAKLVINRKPGEFWRQYSSGGWFPTYYLVETKSHLVTINFGDEEELNFRPQPNPQSSSIIPIEYLDSMNYVPVGDTRGTVVPNIQPYFVYGGIGEVELLDLSVNLYNPTGYKYTMPDGYSYYFDNSNSVSQLRYNLSSITDPNGTTITLNPSGLIRSDGLSIEFIRDAEGRITSLLDPNGNEITYEYNIRGDLAAVIDAEGNRTEFIYDANHNLLEINDPLGRAVQRQEFDEEGHLIAITDAKGGRIEIEYDLGSNTEIVRDKRGNPTIYEYDINGNVVQKTEFPEVNGTPQAVVTSYVYDANNNLISQTKPNGSITEFTYSAKDELLTKTIDAGGLNLSTIYTYDSAGRVLTVTDPIGNVVTNTYDSNGNLTSRTDRLGNVTTYNYNAQGLVSRKTDPLGNYVEYTYNPLGNKIREEMFSMGGISLRLMEFTYDNNGNKLKETLYVTKNGTSIPLTTVYEYNNNDRIVSVTDPMSNVTRTEYDATEQKIADINPLGLRIEYIYDNIGNLIETKYPDGTSTLCEYDSDGNRISVTNRNGQKTTYEFDAVKRIVQASYPDGATRQTFFDEVGNFIAEVDERGNRIDHTYDAAGRRISTIQPLVFNAATGTNERPLTLYEYDANGNRTAVTDGNGNRTEFTYDKENRKTVTTFPDTNIATVDYDALGREIERTDTSGLTTTFQYDELGHLIRVSLPPPKAGDPNPETLYAYDEAGNLISQTDANGHVTLFEYDLLGRRTARQLPGGQRETFQYDAAGNLIRHTDFNGATIIYTYNEAGRQVLIEHPNGFSVATVYAGEGQRIRVNDSQGETVLLYDGRNRLLEVTYPSGQFVSNIYDDAGNKIQVITPGGVTNYTFDALNRLSTVTDPAFGITEYLYDAVGNQVEVINANGSYGEYTYNSRNQLEKLTNLKSDSSVINSYEYVLDTNGLRTQVNEHDGSSVSYIYDNNHRLIRETRTGTDPYNISYSYDPVGNRISMERDGIITAYAYDSNDRLLSEGPVNYDYDANGNVIKKTQGTDITTYEYDFSNRLIQSTDFAGETTAYVYDFDGNRIKKQDNSSEVNYLVDICSNCGLSQVLEERDGSGTLETLYVYGNDLLSQNHGGVVSYYHYDGLGSTRALTSDSEEVTDTYTFDAYGKLNSSSGITQNNYLFAGEQFDPNVGLYYLRARYYDQNTGRFFSMDPVMGDPQTPISLHRYLYANDNPVNFVDPTGMMTLIEINISISIQTTLRSIYTKNLLKFFFKAVKIIYCTIEPAYRMQDIGFDMIFSGLPGGELLINQSRDQIAKGFAAIGAAIVDTYKQIGNDIISVKTEVSGLLKDLYDAYNSGTIPIPVPDELAKLLEFKKRLEGWMQSFADALEDVDSILHGDKCAQFTVIAKYADWVIDKIPDF